MSIPVDKNLYNRVKKEIFENNPINSAYRSGLLVKTYKERYEKNNPGKSPYIDINSKKPLKRWFMENWRNQKNMVGYSQKGDIYRPTIKISKDTPKTFNELSNKEINKAMLKKKKTGKVDKF